MSNLSKDPALKYSPLSKPTGTVLQLWGNSFSNLTARRRANILKTTDYAPFLQERYWVSIREEFFFKMVMYADDDRKPRNIGRSGLPPQRSYTRENICLSRSGKDHGRYGGLFQPYRGSNEFKCTGMFIFLAL